MNIGVSTACFYPMETIKALRLITEQSDSSLELEVFFNTHSELEPSYVRKLREEAGGCKIASVHPFTSGFEPFLFFTEYEKRFQDALDFYRRYFEAMQLLGARILVFHGDRKESVFEEQRYFERFARLARLGRESGVIVAQENVARCRSGSAAFIARMYHALGDDACFVYDVKQERRAGEEPARVMQAMGERIVGVHVSDCDNCHDCICPGDGNFDFYSLVASLQKNGYQGNLTVELYVNGFDDVNHLLRGCDYIRSVIGKTEKNMYN